MLFERVPQLVNAEQLRTDFIAEIHMADGEFIIFEGEAGDYLVRDAQTDSIISVMDEVSFEKLYTPSKFDAEGCCDECGTETTGTETTCADDSCDYCDCYQAAVSSIEQIEQTEQTEQTVSPDIIALVQKAINPYYAGSYRFDSPSVWGLLVEGR